MLLPSIIPFAYYYLMKLETFQLFQSANAIRQDSQPIFGKDQGVQVLQLANLRWQLGQLVAPKIQDLQLP